jgi:hypothetical protein
MGKMIYNTIEYLTMFIMCINLFFSFRATLKPNCIKQLKSFFWYPVVGCIVVIFIILNRLDLIPRNIHYVINKISLLFHFTFLGFIFYKIDYIDRKRIIKFLILLVDVLLVFVIYVDIKQETTSAFAIANGCLFCFSLYYFYKIIVKSPIQKITNDPIFIVVCGIFLGTGLVLPFTIMHKFFLVLNVPKDTMLLFGCSVATGYFIMNLFFLKSMICIIQRS